MIAGAHHDWHTVAGTLRRRWWVLVVAAVAGAALGTLSWATSTRSYEATAEMLLPQRDPVATLLGVDVRPAQPERDFDTRVGLITTEPVAETVRRRLGLSEPADALLGRVSTSVQGNSGIVAITASSGDARTSARIANAFAGAYADHRARVARAALDARVAGAQRELARLGPGADLTPEGRDLVDALRRVQTAAAFEGRDAELVSVAHPPKAAAGLGALPAAGLGALLSTLVAAGAVAIRARSHHALQGEDEVERALGVPVLGRAGPGASEDAYADLAARIAFETSSRPAVALMFTSPAADAPTQEVVLGVAAALRTLGRKAVAVEADLRDPRFADELGQAPVGGLAAVLRGRASLATELVEVPAPARPRADAHAWALPAGRPEARPHELLTADAMARVMDRARRRARYVLVAAAPLARLPEAQALAPFVDGAMLVVRAGATTDEAARRARRRLEDVGVPVVGAVLVEGTSRARRERRRLLGRRDGRGARR